MTSRCRRAGLCALMSLVLVTGCSNEDDESCTAGTTDGCAGGQVCEEVQGAEPACFAPVEIEGMIFDATDESPIEGAAIVALDINGGARSSVARSDVDGNYSLPIAAVRTSEGVPVDDSVTLRVSAAGYQPFPTAPRTALPIQLSDAERSEDEEAHVVDNAATDVALLALEGDTSGLVTVSGHVDHEDAGGVLVVAERGSDAVSSAVTDDNGDFVLFNVPTGETFIDGYRAGLAVEDTTISVSSDGASDVTLAATSEGLATVSGSVEIVDAPGGLTTSVILVVRSTFDADAVRGEAPAGLRAGDVSGAFSIEDVPPGRYAVLAAFENDELVRDPDEGIAGTDIVFTEVDAEGNDVTLEQGFKITEALAVMSPGAERVEVISDTNVTMAWADDASEDGFELRVYDAFGTLVHENTEIAPVTGSATASYTWSDAALEPGMIYQFRVVSFREPPMRARSYISATEDLRGVFQFSGGM